MGNVIYRDNVINSISTSCFNLKKFHQNCLCMRKSCILYILVLFPILRIFVKFLLYSLTSPLCNVMLKLGHVVLQSGIGFTSMSDEPVT